MRRRCRNPPRPLPRGRIPDRRDRRRDRAAAAAEVDRTAAFRVRASTPSPVRASSPRRAPLDSAAEEAPADVAAIVEQIAGACSSTAMVVLMHFSAVSVLEAHGPRDVREAVAEGRHLSTLAFSEAGTRSHFWSPAGTAVRDGDGVRLDARKSWITAAGEADSYVWSSRPLAADGPMTLWRVPSTASGLSEPGAFDGLGLRGNASRPITADGVVVPADALLGADGAGRTSRCRWCCRPSSRERCLLVGHRTGPRRRGRRAPHPHPAGAPRPVACRAADHPGAVRGPADPDGRGARFQAPGPSRSVGAEGRPLGLRNAS